MSGLRSRRRFGLQGTIFYIGSWGQAFFRPVHHHINTVFIISYCEAQSFSPSVLDYRL